MAQDVFKPKGTTKAYEPDAGGANPKTVPVFGTVKDNIDPLRSGRLLVYITGFGGDDPNNRDNWVTVNYMTPFYGATIPDAGMTGYGSYIENPSSYGMWYAQPDIDTTVICIFINGDINYGFWIGCVPKPEALTMVPAIGAFETVVTNEGEAQSYGGATRLPVTNINTNNTSIANSEKFISAAKPVHSYQAGIMTQQGINRDPVRGPISSSSQRETPSRVGWGVSTPGRPVYTGGYTDESLAEAVASGSPPADSALKVIARRGGHSIVMDDGDRIGRDQLIRIRTAQGHQILMSDDGQTLMILHSNGQSYVELGKEGTVDVYSTNSINLRTQGDLNLHADNNINIHAAKEFNVQAENIKFNSEKEFTTRSGTNTRLYTVNNFTVKSDAAMSLESAADSSFVSKNNTYINGEKINLNTGASSTIPQDVKIIPIVAHTDTLQDPVKGFAAAPAKLLSITSRAPAHAPWANAGQGVDVKVSLSASDNLPPPPTGPVGAANALASTIPTNLQNPGVSVSTAAAMPSVGAISKTLDKNTTSALLGAAASIAATPGSPFAKAVTTGFAIANVNSITSMAIGTFGQTPSQLVAGGVLKAGADKLVGALLNSNLLNITPPGLPTDVTKILPNNLFTGKTGAETAINYINNQFAQGAAQVTNFQQAQTALTKGGVISGTESVNQLSGLVLAGAQAGISQTVDAVKSAAAAVAGGVKTIDPSNVTGALKSIAAGGAAAAIAQNVTGGLGGVSKALGSLSNLSSGNLSLGSLLDSTKGVAGSAFNAITSQFRPLVAGIPQNLRKIAEDNAKSIADLSGGVNKISAGIAATSSAIASGLSNLPGGQKVVQGVIDKAGTAVAGAVNQLPGAGTINKLATDAFNSTVNKLGSLPTIPNTLGGLVNKAVTAGGLGGIGLSGGAAAQLQSSIAALSSGGSVPIKLPTVGFNTTKRDDITKQVDSVLGSAKIPRPNFTGEKTPTATSAAQAIEDYRITSGNLIKELQDAEKVVETKRYAYYELEKIKPQGDPELQAALSAWNAALVDAEAKRKAVNDYIKYQEDDPTKSGG